MTDHHPPTRPAGPPPTARQQRYLRQLAVQRGVTFVVPKHPRRSVARDRRAQAPAPEPVADRRREIRAVQDDMARGRGDDAQRRRGRRDDGLWQQRDLEGRPLVTATIQHPAAGRRDERRVELARYTVSGGRARDHGQRVLGVVRLVDDPASGAGRHYVIERELTSMAELEAIVADYLQQAAAGT